MRPPLKKYPVLPSPSVGDAYNLLNRWPWVQTLRLFLTRVWGVGGGWGEAFYLAKGQVSSPVKWDSSS